MLKDNTSHNFKPDHGVQLADRMISEQELGKTRVRTSSTTGISTESSGRPGKPQKNSTSKSRYTPIITSDGLFATTLSQRPSSSTRRPLVAHSSQCLDIWASRGARAPPAANAPATAQKWAKPRFPRFHSPLKIRSCVLLARLTSQRLPLAPRLST